MWMFLGVALASPYLPDGDRVVQGTVNRFEYGNLRTQWELSKALDFQVTIPETPEPVVCLQITDTVVGDVFGDSLCFWRLSDLALTTTGLVVGDNGLWTIRESAFDGHFYATEANAYAPSQPKVVPSSTGSLEQQLLTEGHRAIPAIQRAIESGTPEETRQALELVSKYGILPLLPSALAALADTRPAPRPNHPLGEPIALVAEKCLLKLGERLDGTAPERRTIGRFLEGTLDPRPQTLAVQTDWTTWWKHWQTEGPPRRENPKPHP